MSRDSDWSVSALAYLGDFVVELFVSESLVGKGLSHSSSLNRAALDFVCASAQAAAMERLLPHLTDEEALCYRRGRNSGHLNFPKNAKPAQYRMATGMEVLFGYLHVTGQESRARELFALAYGFSDSENENTTENKENTHE